MTDIVDVVIIGAGPAGMAAAIAARKHQLSCVVLDEQPMPGGQIFRNITSPIGDDKARILGKDYLAGRTVVEEFLACGANYLPRSSVWGVEEGTVHFVRDGVSRSVVGRAVVGAIGAMERPYPVPGWTLPGVMTAGAAQIILKSSDVLAKDAVFVGTGPLLYLVSAQYIRAGFQPRAIIDTSAGLGSAVFRSIPSVVQGIPYLVKGASMFAAIRASGTPWIHGASDIEFRGDGQVEAVRYRQGGRAHEIATSTVFMHQGLVPNPNLGRSLRCEYFWDESQMCFRPVRGPSGRTSLDWFWMVGDCGGIFGAKAALLAGELAGNEIAQVLGKISGATHTQAATPLMKRLGKDVAIRTFLERAYRPPTNLKSSADDPVIVCRCEEVTRGEVVQAMSEGCMGPNQLKAFSRCGMGPCNGRMCGPTVTDLMARTANQSHEDCGYFRIRQPIKPLTVAELAQTEN